MEELLRGWDGEHVVVRYDREADAWIFIAIHSTRLGNASGGTRMKVYDEPQDIGAYIDPSLMSEM